MKTILLLHGALGAKDQLQHLQALLSADYNVHSFNFTGHGGDSIPARFSIPSFASQIEDYISKNDLEQVYVFGYSMGGYAALYLAATKPGIINGIVTLGTKLHWDEPIAAKETSMMQPEVIEAKVPKFAAQLQQKHQPSDWKELMNKTASMLLEMGTSNPLTPEHYKQINIPVLLMLGDRDKMVSIEETIDAYKSIETSQFAILPDTPHQVEQVDVELISILLKRFIG